MGSCIFHKHGWRILDVPKKSISSSSLHLTMFVCSIGATFFIMEFMCHLQIYSNLLCCSRSSYIVFFSICYAIVPHHPKQKSFQNPCWKERRIDVGIWLFLDVHFKLRSWTKMSKVKSSMMLWTCGVCLKENSGMLL
jgi:hypothetical protein